MQRLATTVLHKLKYSYRVKDWWIPNKTFLTSNNTISPEIRDKGLKSNEACYIHLNAGLRLESLSIPVVNTVPHGGQTESLWNCNYGRKGSEYSTSLYEVFQNKILTFESLLRYIYLLSKNAF